MRRTTQYSYQGITNIVKLPHQLPLHINVLIPSIIIMRMQNTQLSCRSGEDSHLGRVNILASSSTHFSTRVCKSLRSNNDLTPPDFLYLSQHNVITATNNNNNTHTNVKTSSVNVLEDYLPPHNQTDKMNLLQVLNSFTDTATDVTEETVADTTTTNITQCQTKNTSFSIWFSLPRQQ